MKKLTEEERERQEIAAEHHRVSACLMAIARAPLGVTPSAMSSVAYDTVFNLIPPDVAEFQLVKRSEDETKARLTAQGGDTSGGDFARLQAENETVRRCYGGLKTFVQDVSRDPLNHWSARAQRLLDTGVYERDAVENVQAPAPRAEAAPDEIERLLSAVTPSHPQAVNDIRAYVQALHRPQPAPMVSEKGLRRVILDWVRDHASVAAKMSWKPEQTEALLVSILNHIKGNAA